MGYQRDSWVKELLIKQIGIKKDHLKPLESYLDYENPLSNEKKEERVDAILMKFRISCSSFPNTTLASWLDQSIKPVDSPL